MKRCLTSLLPIVAPAFGFREGQALFLWTYLRGRMRKPTMRIEQWSDRFPRIVETSRIGYDAVPVSLDVRAPRMIVAASGTP